MNTLETMKLEQEIDKLIDVLIAADYPEATKSQQLDAGENWKCTCEAYGVEMLTPEGAEIYMVCLGSIIEG